MNIYLVRHGESEENIKGTFYGRTDCGLSDKGKLQAVILKDKLKNIAFDKIYCSPTKRAKETLDLICDNNNSLRICDKRLSEINFGEFEGKSYTEILKLYASECKLWEQDWISFVPPKGESYKELYNRVEEFMNDMLRENYDNVLIVTHGGVIRSIYSYVMNGNLELFWKFGCNNCDMARIKFEYGNLFIDSICHFDS